MVNHSVKMTTSLNEKDSDSEEKYLNMLMQLLSALVELPAEQIDVNQGLENYLVDSVKLLQFVSVINSSLQINIEPTLLFEYGTIKDIAKQIAVIHSAELKVVQDSNKKTLFINLIASFTGEPLSESLEYLFYQIMINPVIKFAPYNQVFQQLHNQQSIIYSSNDCINVILFRIEDFFRFKNEELSLQKCQEIVHEFISLVQNYALNAKNPMIIVMCPHTPSSVRRLGLSEHLDALDEKILSDIHSISNLYPLDLRQLGMMYNIPRVLDEARDKMGHIPFSQEFYAAMGLAIVRLVFSLKAEPKKVIVVDCDNTLWGGVCGEEGALNVSIASPFAEFQQLLVEQKDKGKIICLCSKNVEEDVWDVFAKNKNMILKRDDVVAARINWERKSRNLIELAEELNLGLDSFIFIDDNPIECDEIEQALPEVLVIRVPENLQKMLPFFQNHWAFDVLKVTSEDKKRTLMYQENAKRDALKKTVSNLEDYIKTLEVQIKISPLHESDLVRASQLTFRTNQFNATALRQTESELQQFMKSADKAVFTVHVCDKYGDYGFVGLMITEIAKDKLNCINFLMSCRVLGRKVEQTMLRYLADFAQQKKLSVISLFYTITSRNKPLLDFYGSLQLDAVAESDDRFNLTFSPDSVDLLIQKSKIEHNLAENQAPSPIENSVNSFNQQIWKKISEIVSYYGNISDLVLSFKKLALIKRPDLSTEYIAPRTDWQRKIAAIWRDVLRIDRVGIYDNFYELGGSSLSAAEMFAKMWDIGVPELISLQNMPEPTIAGLTQSMEEVKQGKRLSLLTDFYSLEDEGQVPEDIIYKGKPVPFEKMTMDCVFITGGTGYIGAYIIYELLEQTNCDIICLVRASTNTEGKKRVANNLEHYGLWHSDYAKRISTVCGDLNEERFSLPPEEFQALANQIDCIFHCGAWVNFVYPYEAIKKSNVGSVETVLRLSVANPNHLIQVHFISTFGVVMSPDYRDEIVYEHEELRHCEGLLNGYEQSKYVGDKMVWRGIHERGLAANIYRPALVGGLGSSGVYYKLNEFLPSFIKGCIQLGSIPILEPDGYIEIALVDFISKAIVGIAKNSKNLGKAYFSLHPHSVYSKDLIEAMTDFGYHLRVLPFDIWKKEMLNQPSDHLHMNALFPFIDFIRILSEKNAFFTNVDRSNFLKAIEPLNIDCPDSITLLNRYLSYFVRVNFLPSPLRKDE